MWFIQLHLEDYVIINCIVYCKYYKIVMFEETPVLRQNANKKK